MGVIFLVVVFDCVIGQLVFNGNMQIIVIVLVVKLFIVDDLLLVEVEGKVILFLEDYYVLDVMLQLFDDGVVE